MVGEACGTWLGECHEDVVAGDWIGVVSNLATPVDDVADIGAIPRA
jgi:hypothetical protein